jgi:hypothetical protein
MPPPSTHIESTLRPPTFSAVTRHMDLPSFALSPLAMTVLAMRSRIIRKCGARLRSSARWSRVTHRRTKKRFTDKS